MSLLLLFNQVEEEESDTSSTDFNLTSIGGVNKPPINFELSGNIEISPPSFDISVQMSVVDVVGSGDIDVPSFDISVQMSVANVIGPINIDAPSFDIITQMSVSEIWTSIQKVQADPFNIEVGFSVNDVYLLEVLSVEPPAFDVDVEFSITEINKVFNISVSEFDLSISMSAGPIWASLYSVFEERYALPIISRVFTVEDSLRLIVNSEYESNYLLSESPNNEFTIESSLRVSSEHEEEYLLSYQIRKELETEYSLRPVITNEFESTYYIADTIRLVFVDESDLSSLDPISTEFSAVSSLIKGTSTFYSFTVSAEV